MTPICWCNLAPRQIQANPNRRVYASFKVFRHSKNALDNALRTLFINELEQPLNSEQQTLAKELLNEPVDKKKILNPYAKKSPTTRMGNTPSAWN